MSQNQTSNPEQITGKDGEHKESDQAQDQDSLGADQGDLQEQGDQEESKHQEDGNEGEGQNDNQELDESSKRYQTIIIV